MLTPLYVHAADDYKDACGKGSNPTGLSCIREDPLLINKTSNSSISAIRIHSWIGDGNYDDDKYLIYNFGSGSDRTVTAYDPNVRSSYVYTGLPIGTMYVPFSSKIQTVNGSSNLMSGYVLNSSSKKIEVYGNFVAIGPGFFGKTGGANSKTTWTIGFKVDGGKCYAKQSYDSSSGYFQLSNWSFGNPGTTGSAVSKPAYALGKMVFILTDNFGNTSSRLLFLTTIPAKASSVTNPVLADNFSGLKNKATVDGWVKQGLLSYVELSSQSSDNLCRTSI